MFAKQLLHEMIDLEEKLNDQDCHLEMEQREHEETKGYRQLAEQDRATLQGSMDEVVVDRNRLRESLKEIRDLAADRAQWSGRSPFALGDVEQLANAAIGEGDVTNLTEPSLRTVVQDFIYEVEAGISPPDVGMGSGMHVASHHDFVSAPPSVKGQLRWWVKRFRSVMGGGK